MKTYTKFVQVSYPRIATGTVAFSFTADTPLGTFGFGFKWLNSQWNGWATLPSGEVRQFGCVPGCVSWVDFMDFGLLLDSALPALGLGDLVAHSVLYLLGWGAN